MNYTRFELNLISISVLKLCLNRGSPRVYFWLGHTSLDGSAMWSVGFKESERPRSTDTDSLSDLFLATGSGSKGQGEMGGCSPGWPRVSIAGGEEWLQEWTSSSFWRFLNHGDCTTGFGMTRQSRWRGWLGRLHPVVSESLGWRHTGGRNFGRQGSAWSDAKKNEEGSQQTSWHRNRWKTEAGAAGSGELFWQPGGAIRRESRGEMERVLRATYRHGGRSNWIGIQGHWMEESMARLRQNFWTKVEDDRVLTCGARLSVAGSIPLRVSCPAGPWASSEARSNSFPGAFSSFLNSFSFCFFCFSNFFHIICKNASNQFKPFSEIF
jgi:hypothetical protein